MGATLVLLLAVACSSDREDGMTGANISDFLAATGGSEAAAQLLRYNLGASTGIWVNGTGKATGDPDLGIINLEWNLWQTRRLKPGKWQERPLSRP